MIGHRVVPQGELRAIWPWVKRGLDKVGEKTVDDWMPEDVWASLRVGGATLYVYDADGEDIGFAVMQKQAGTDGPILFVWASWFEPMRYRRHVKELLPLLDDTARSIGAKEVRHQSNRVGWGYKDDFVQHSIIWRRVVPPKEAQWEKAAVVAAAAPRT